MPVIAGTGHRPDKLGGYKDVIFRKTYQLAFDSLNEWKSNIDVVISGGALGWDTALALAAIDLDIKLICALPFKGQESRWPRASQEKYNEILNKSDEIVYVCEDGYAPWKMQVRNEWMVNHCDIVLALWNGSPGGTGNCIKYAKKVNKPIKNVWDYWEED